MSRAEITFVLLIVVLVVLVFFTAVLPYARWWSAPLLGSVVAGFAINYCFYRIRDHASIVLVTTGEEGPTLVPDGICFLGFLAVDLIGSLIASNLQANPWYGTLGFGFSNVVVFVVSMYAWDYVFENDD